ncbi:MAG: ABC transporter permease [Chloroflexota bacterium]
MQLKRKRPSFLTQYIDLFLIELTNWRWAWQSMITLSLIAPLMSMAGLWVFARDNGEKALLFVLTGNVILAIMFGTIDKVQSHFMFMKMQGSFNYFATLPIKKSALLLAVVTTFFLFNLPAVIVNLFVGSWLLNIQLKIHPLILIVIPLSSLTLSGIGALIASYARNPAESGTISTLITFLFLGLGPVLFPPEQLPNVLLQIGWLSPGTYAASALRQTVVGPVTPRFWLDIGVLSVWGLILFALVERQMEWRENK